MINKYLSLAIVFAIAFILGVILFKIFIPFLRRVKLGQKILEIGPSWHKSKEGTPNLGGLIFIIAMMVALVVGIFIVPKPEYPWTLGSFGMDSALVIVFFALSQALIGFIDDYVKLFKKRNKGLSATQKFILQFATTGAYLVLRGEDTAFRTPWGSVDLGIFYYILMLLAIVYIVNCANLTDGIDGLAGSIAFIICIMFLLLGINLYFGEDFPANSYGFVLPVAALAGALLAFLVFNFHPAKIFMGDTGSLFLGAFFVGLVMHFDYEFLLIPIGCMWIIEGVSVVLQVASFKLFKKRIFKMAPIHHHFEKCGWGEVKVVAVFGFVTLVLSVIAWFAI